MYRQLLFALSLFAALLPLPAVIAQTDCSGGGTGGTAVIKVVNYSSAPIGVYWINFDCAEQLYATLAPNVTFEQPTYDRHQWIIRAEDASEIGRLTASESELRTIIVGKDPKVAAPTSPLGFAYTPVTPSAISDEVCAVTAVPPELNLDSFYGKYCDFNGIPIISSANVPDEALQAAYRVAAAMLSPHPQVIEVMRQYNLKMGIAAASEGITDLPEYHFLKDDPSMDWDERARGLGGSVGVPLVSGAEENVLCYTIDPYLGENIFVHELAHTIKDVGISQLDATFNEALQLAYEEATAAGLWENTYALSNRDEYWAEGVQSYFNTNLESDPPNGIHNSIDTRDELHDYDPTLYAMIDRVFAGLEWTPSCPA